MNFKVIDFDNKKEWEKVTEGREVYYQWQYVDAFYKIGDGIPKLAYAEDNNQFVFTLFLLRNIGNDLKIESAKKYYDITTPYGYGGVDIKDKNIELLNYFFQEFTKYCCENNIISEFLRLCPFTDNFMNYVGHSDYKVINCSKTVSIKLETPEQIWNDMEGRCRTTIRKANNSNLQIKSGFSIEMLEEFKYIYKDTMSRDNADNYYFFEDIFFESIYENLKEYARIYTVYLNNKPISSSIILFNGVSAHYHLSGTLCDYMKYGANNFGLYQVALDLCSKGFKSLHLGGGYGGDSSPLLKFKQSFNKYGDLDFYIGKRIYNEEIYNKLCDIRGVDNTEVFFPAYRKD